MFRTDDGSGARWCGGCGAGAWPDGVRVVDYGIRGLHLAYDLLEPWDALVMVDALPERGAGGSSSSRSGRTTSAPAAVDAHGMDPATVLASLAALGGPLPPRPSGGLPGGRHRRRHGAHPAGRGGRRRGADRAAVRELTRG